MKYPNYNSQDIEPQILEFWQKKKIVQKLRDRNKDGKKFYFLDGPPYTSGKFHLGHAWNYAIKDLAVRYKRMHGLNVWDRNGFDVHGLPTEHKVMAKFDLHTKEDIERFGVDRFVTECQKFCLEMADVMTKDLVRMGVSLDLSNPYMALKTEFIEGQWDLIKKAHEKDLLYYGEKVLTWCQHCETAVAKHECEYKNVNDKSIFVKFPVVGKDNEFLVIWTTTPWTIPFNLAVMVNPDVDYVRVKVENEVWILAKALAGLVVKSAVGLDLEVIEEFKGTTLEGVEYSHPFALPKYKELKKEHPNVHTVILSKEFVDTSCGSGLVHSAPGCGPEDQQACKPYDIPPFNPLSEDGFFPEEMGKFAGLRAKINDNDFIDALKKAGVLLAITRVEHEYPHCWRCKNPIIFRITYQWFLKIEEIKKKILAGNDNVKWVPDTALNAYEAWVGNLKDNSISRQRYWGTPVPVWRCESCPEIKVVSSREEIKANSGTPPENLHLPWIDAVKLKCKCNGVMTRVPDVIDVWVDAGTTSWNCLGNDPQKMKDWYPADFIMEAKEQTRLWFSMLSICSYIYLDKNAFENVYVYGMLNDLDGKKMSKSLGNIISPYELIDKYGVDVLRVYMCQNNAGEDINFSWDECKVKQRQLLILWNVHKFLIDLAKENSVNPSKLEIKELGIEEKYILSKLHSTIDDVTAFMESYHIDEAIAPIEDLYLELSRTYIQTVRDKAALGTKEEKERIIHTVYTVFIELLKMFNVFAPFISETIYQNLRFEFDLFKESISHFNWPEFDEKLIDKELETKMQNTKKIIQATLQAREKAQLGLRWPVKEVIIVGVTNVIEDIIRSQTNTKSVVLKEKLAGVKYSIKPDYGKIGPVFGKRSPKVIAYLGSTDSQTILNEIEKNNVHKFSLDGEELEITKEMLIIEHEVPDQFGEGEFKGGFVYLDKERTPELEAEGYAREIMRKIQSLRKDADLQKLDRIDLKLNVSEKMAKSLLPFTDMIKDKVGADSLQVEDIPGEEFSIKGEMFVVSFDKK
jgi:isoleucyl-tRNA synthetase